MRQPEINKWQFEKGNDMKSIKNMIIALLALLWLSACGGNGVPESAEALGKRQIRVVTTTGMIADAVRNVGGERVDVQALMGPGVDPHLYKASEGDVTRMSRADIIFYNGLHLEGKMSEIFDRMRQRIQTVAVSEGAPAARLLKPAEFEGNYDPHIWFDVSMWREAVRRVEAALVALDSTHAATYRRNAAAYVTELDALHQYVLGEAQRVPPAKRVLITAHDAFNYFGAAYGFEVHGLQGISTALETGTADVQGLAALIVARRIPAVFVESSVPPRYIEALQAAVKSRGFDVKIGGNLFSDAMGSAGTPEGTYPGMVRHNIDTIVAALLAGDTDM